MLLGKKIGVIERLGRGGSRGGGAGRGEVYIVIETLPSTLRSSRPDKEVHDQLGLELRGHWPCPGWNPSAAPSDHSLKSR